MGERVRWEVEKDLREHNIELEDEDEEIGAQKVEPAVLTYVWHNRKALVFNLQQHKVIRYVVRPCCRSSPAEACCRKPQVRRHVGPVP